MGHVRTVTISYDEYQELKEGKYTSLIEELNEANSKFASLEKHYDELCIEVSNYRNRVNVAKYHIKHLEKENASLKQFDDSWLVRLFTKTKNK